MAALLEPGSDRAASLVDDAALVRAMVRVESTWLHALAGAGQLDPENATVLDGRVVEIPRPRTVEGPGNPVPPLVAALRHDLDPETAALVHRGLTSQDTLDTALMLLARDVLDAVTTDLDTVAAELASLAERHRGSVMAGRTLTQYAVPVTFGLKTAQWLVGVLEASDAADAVRRSLPVQCGGAAGTLALAADLVTDPVLLATGFADRLGLLWPGMPWHTRRSPVTRLGDALVGVCDAVGVIASDVLLLGRPEIGEVREVPAEGAGGSSTMPHKQNPVLSVLVRSAALQAPLLGAQLHLCATQSTDERPDGAWHAEWPPLQRLMSLSATATSQAADLVSSLHVDSERMRTRVEAESDLLLAERGRHEPGDPTSYLGAAGAFVDDALSRYAERRHDRAPEAR